MTFSAVGTIQVFDARSPLYADISAGYAWALVLVNQTDNDITAGTFTIQQAPPSADDRCVPDAAQWADVEVAPQCDDPPGTVAAPGAITLSTDQPLKAHSQCQYSVPCVGPFIRVTASGGGAANVGAFIVV